MSERMEDILEVTRDLMLEIGLDAISMRKIADKAGVKIGTLYYWFENKVDLINQTYVHSRNKLLPNVKTIDKNNMEESLKKYMRLYVGISASHFKDLLFVENLHLSHIIKPESIQDVDVYIGDVKLSKLMELGLIKKMEPEMIDVALVGMMNKTIIYKMSKNKTMTEAEKDDLATLCWDAIKA